MTKEHGLGEILGESLSKREKLKKFQEDFDSSSSSCRSVST